MTEPHTRRQDAAVPPGPAVCDLGPARTLCGHQVPLLSGEFIRPAKQCVRAPSPAWLWPEVWRHRKERPWLLAKGPPGLAVQGGRNHSVIASSSRGKCRCWGSVSRHRPASVPTQRGPCVHSWPLTSGESVGKTGMEGRAGPGEATVTGYLGGTGLSPQCTVKKQASSLAVSCSGFLRPRAGTPPRPSPCPSPGWLEGSEGGIG